MIDIVASFINLIPVTLALLKRRLAEQGSELMPSTPDEFASYIRAEIPRWAEIVRVSGATAD